MALKFLLTDYHAVVAALDLNSPTQWRNGVAVETPGDLLGDGASSVRKATGQRRSKLQLIMSVPIDIFVEVEDPLQAMSLILTSVIGLRVSVAARPLAAGSRV